MDSSKLGEWIQWGKRAKEYLYDVDLIHKEFPAHTEHDHCELCWARFGDYPNDLKTGYYDRTNDCWICEDCYGIFKDVFNWSLGA